MGKKKLLKEIESLKSMNDNLIKRLAEEKEEFLCKDILLVMDILKRHGDVTNMIERENSDFFASNKTFTFILKSQNF